MRTISIFRTLLFGSLLLGTQPVAADVVDDAISSKRPPRLLSEYGFFTDLLAMTPDEKLIPYVVSAPLFSDYADKTRFIYAPGPAPEPKSASEPLEFPIGSALIKTFHYGPSRIETRVLLHQESGWKGYAYLWRADNSDADLKIAGANLDLETEYGQVSYRVPNVNQCKACHTNSGKEVVPLGPKLRNLDIAGQLQDLVTAEVLTAYVKPENAVPDYRDNGVALDLRARAYLDANCGHCHAPSLPADTSGLYLHWEETDLHRLGVLKPPIAAGRGSGGLRYDIVPGDADASILVFRMEHTDPGIMMPELGRSLAHTEGIALVRQWISEMK